MGSISSTLVQRESKVTIFSSLLCFFIHVSFRVALLRYFVAWLNRESLIFGGHQVRS